MVAVKSKGTVLIVFYIGAAFVAAESMLAQPLAVQHSTGRTAQAAVPMVSETWSSTLAASAPGLQKHQTRFIGHYPGFRAAKKAANQRVTRRTSARSLTTRTQKLSLAPQAPSVSTVVFDGPSESDTPFIPPDSQIAAGPTYVVAVINSLMAIYDKTGVQQGGFQQLSSFFSTLGVSGEIFDPRIIYDQTDNRFILSAAEVDMTNFTNGHVLIAVSQTSDPQGVWNKFAIDFMGRNVSNTANTFPDYPVLGLSSSAIYITTNQFQLTQQCLSTDNEGCRFSDAWISVIGLPQLLSPTPPSTLTITTFKDVTGVSGRLAFTIQPALTYGTPGSEFLVGADFSSNPSSTLNVFAIPTSGTPTLSKADLTVPSFSMPPNAVQGGSGTLIDTNDFRLLNAVWTNGSLWCGQNAADSQAGGVGARSYEITLSDLSSMTLGQSGTVSGGGEAYFPALSIKADGTVAMAFSTSSSSQPASAAFTAREPGDAAGAMRGFSIYRQGSGPYDESIGNRWGDYSGISEDPDGNSIWMITEFAGTPDPHFGTGIVQVTGAPNITATPSTLNFGAVLVGQTSPAQTVTVTNLSSSATTIGQIALAGQNAASYSVTADACSNTSLAAGQTCQVSVTLSPTATGPRIIAYLSIPGGTGNTTTVELTGEGTITGVLSITPPSMTFPSTAQQTASAPQTVTVSNTGNAAATITNVTINSDFTETNTCGSSLVPGASCQFKITFRPTAAGTFQGDINFLSNTQAEFYTISLSGVGITAPSALFCPDSLNFGNQVTNTTSSSQTVVLTNSGSDQLTITGTSVSGDFSLTSNCPGSMAPRSSCTLNVTFTPTAIGTLNGALLVYDNTQGSPQSIQLTGTGVSATAQGPLPGNGIDGPESSGQQGAAPGTSVHLASTTPEGEFKVPGSNQSPRRRTQARKSFASLPLTFEANIGQTSRQARFISRGTGYAMFLTARGAVLELAGRKALPGKTASADENQKGSHQPSMAASVLQMRLQGANPRPKVVGFDQLSGKANYFIGKDPSKWHTNVPLYARVRFRDIYPGINLVYYGNQRQLEYDFVVAPGADPGKIRFSFRGQSHILVDHEGNLVLTTPAGRVWFHKPLVYQRTGGKAVVVRANPKSHSNRRKRLDGAYVLLSSNQVAFGLGPYDHRKPLVIDPVLSFSTYLGGSGGDAGNAIAVDSSGNAYVAGKTASVDFPLTNGAFQTNCGTQNYPCSYPFNYDAFVAKLSPDGSQLLYATYLGGSSTAQTEANGIAVDSSGNAYVAGSTYSNDFPTTPGSFQPQPAGTLQYSDRSSAFVAKLNSTGSSLIYSTYLGGTPNNFSVVSPGDSANGIALDVSGEAIITGTTSASDFPTTPGAFQTTGPGYEKVIGFVTKLNAAGSGLVFSTYLGGTSDDVLNAVALDSSGNIYVAGTANSFDFPTTPGAFQTGSYSYTGSYTSPGPAGVTAKFTPAGKIVYSTYLGSSGSAITVGPTGAVYVSGRASEYFPVTPNALNTTYSPYAAFIAKLHPAGCALLYGSFLNPTTFGANENVRAIALDSSGDIYLAGGVAGLASVLSFGVKALQPGMQVSPGFINELNPTGTQMLFSSPLGGSGGFGNNNFGDEVRAMALDSGGDIYVTGKTYSQDLPVANAFEAAPPGQVKNGTAFVAKISPAQTTGVTLTRPSLNFYALPIGSTGNPEIQAVGLQNHRATALNISSVALSGSGFSMADINPHPPSCSGSIAAGTGCVVYIQFVPTAMGTAAGTLTINDDGPGSPRTVQLKGEGIADFALDTGTSSSVVGGQAQYTIYAMWVYGAPAGSDALSIDLSCSGVAPATCSFSNNPIAINGTVPNNSILTVGNLSAVSGLLLNFSVVGTASGQTYSLPISVKTSPDFTLGLASGQPSSESVTAGGSASYNINVSPKGGFNQAVSLSCGEMPTLATCSISPDPVTLDGSNSATATVTVKSTARSAAPGAYRLDGPRGFGMNGRELFYGLLLLLAALMAAASLRWSMTAMGHNFRSLLRFSALILLVLLWATCGGGGSSAGGGSSQQSGTPAGTYTITVTGISGILAHGTTFKLTVQ